MKSTKLLAVFLVFALALSLLAGCGKSDPKPADTNGPSDTANGDDNTPDDNAVKKDPVTIDFWHTSTDGPMKDLYTELIAEFEASHDWITVKQLGTTFWDYGPKINTALAGDTGPDIGIGGYGDAEMRARAKAGVALDLTPYIKRDQMDMNQFYSILTNQAQMDGKYYAMPFQTDVRLLYYNKEAFREVGLDPEKPPTNWDELEQYSDALTKWNDNGLLDRIGFSPSLGNLWFWTLAWTNGAKFFDDQGNPTLNTPEALETMKFWVKIQNKYGTKALSAFQAQTGSLGYSPFIAGKVAMIVDVNSLAGQIAVNQPDLDYGVAPIPYQTNKASWSAGFSLQLFNNHNNKAKADAAWEFMKFMVSKDTQIKIHRASGWLVANIEAANDPEFIADPKWKTQIDLLDYSRFMPAPDDAASWGAFLMQNLDAAVAGDKTPEQALIDAQKSIEQDVANWKKANP